MEKARKKLKRFNDNRLVEGRSNNNPDWTSSRTSSCAVREDQLSKCKAKHYEHCLIVRGNPDACSLTGASLA